MALKQPNQAQDETHLYLDQGHKTGIFDWQELAHLDFKDLFDLVRKKNTFREESE